MGTDRRLALACLISAALLLGTLFVWMAVTRGTPANQRVALIGRDVFRGSTGGPDGNVGKGSQFLGHSVAPKRGGSVHCGDSAAGEGSE
jgi:hypothetical protein